YTITDGTDTDTATVTVTVAPPPGSGTSDDFSATTLDPIWAFAGPGEVSSGLGTSGSDAFLILSTPAGDYDVYDENRGARLLQTVADEDFQVEARFLSTPSERYQLQGFLVEQDADNWLRFDTYSDGTNLRAFAATTINGDSSPAFNVTIPGGSAEYLDLTRSGDTWTFRYSADGVNWTTAGSFTHALTVTAVGPMAGSTQTSAGYTAQVDYFEFASDPIADEDGGFVPAPLPPEASDDTLVALPDTALAIDVAADLLANDSDPNNDPLSLDSFTQPANGTVADNGDGTLTYTPNTGFTGADSFTYTITDGTNTDTATVTVTVASPPAAAVSDDFAGATLDPVWTVIGPAGISHALGSTASDAYLELVTPDGDHNIWDTNKGARAMQSQADEDFTLETRFLSTPTDQYQMQGLLVEADADNWLRFDTYSDGNNLRVFAATTVNGDSTPKFNAVIPGGSAPYLRVERSGDLWTMYYSTDGANWTTAGSFTRALTVTSVGVFAGNTGSASGFTAQVDYFETSADPITNEDGNSTPGNTVPDAADDGLSTGQDAALVVNVAADLLANDSDGDGDLLSLDSFTQPTNGTVADNGDGTLTYTPNAGFTGADSFTYTITDGTDTDTATVTVTVTGTPPGNTVPDAADDGLSTGQ
ncbi:tandem-95 repeat protein, partial [Ruegeria arenilitoris]|uniref:tandem-95 repeat protein n=1 Tax=Ruegeria arenilitoris TaxID=1173585 RepID=UPI00147AEF0A